LQLTPVYRDTTYLRQALEFVWNSLGLGALLAVCVLLAFLRSVRSVLVVALSIPVSLITVFLVMDAFGRTLNVVSLAGLAFAAGMVVDNAIVVLENTFRHLEMGKGAREAAVDAGREVWGGVMASTLTTIAVFVPVLGIQEEAGQLFADLALAISAAVGLSLIVSLTVVPCLAALLYRGQRVRRRDTSLAADGAVASAHLGPLARWYARRVGNLTAKGGRRVAVRVALVVVVVAVSLGAIAIVPPAGYLPSGNANLVFFFGAPIPGTRPEALIDHLAPLEQFIRDQPETERYFMVVATSFNGGGVILKDEFANGPDLDAFTMKMLPVCFSVPGFRNMIAIRSSLFRDAGNVFDVEITGPDLDVLARAATDLQRRIGALPSVQRVTSDYVQGRPELRVTADQDLASEAGLTVAGVGAIVETALAGRRVSTFSDGSRDYDVNLVVPPERISSLDDLATLPVVTPTGKRTTLGALARVVPTTGPQSVNRIERQRSIMLSVNLRADAVLQAVLDDVKEHAVPPVLATLPREVRVEMGGSADKFSSTLDSLTNSFWLAILITYLLLVALFRSWGSPFVIMVSVPLALSGGLIGITLAHSLSADASFDLLSMLGFVILAGIVVNNAILIIHQSNNLAADGRPRREALAEASLSRLRPILMSVTTTVFGMAPLAIGGSSGAELYQGLAAVVVGGLILSTLFTLFLVPALVTLGWDIGGALRRAPEPVAATSDAGAGGGATGTQPAAPA
jgi:HAE1 family hydrophobic/amphiphilic exporter-1